MREVEKEYVALMSRVYRAEKEMSQSELAELCGIGQVVLSYLEKRQWDKVSEKNIASVRDKIYELKLQPSVKVGETDGI